MSRYRKDPYMMALVGGAPREGRGGISLPWSQQQQPELRLSLR